MSPNQMNSGVREADQEQADEPALEEPRRVDPAFARASAQARAAPLDEHREADAEEEGKEAVELPFDQESDQEVRERDRTGPPAAPPSARRR